MPLMLLNNKTKDFSMYDANLLPTMRSPERFRSLCWGWGKVKSEPKKFYRTVRVGTKERKIFTVRTWVNLAQRGADEQDIRIDITDEYAEGCQYLTVGDPIWFCGEIYFDHKYSKIKDFPFFLILADMVIPPYSADGREFCARKRHIVEKNNEAMLSQMMQSGQRVPNMDDLGRYLEGEK